MGKLILAVLAAAIAFLGFNGVKYFNMRNAMKEDLLAIAQVNAQVDHAESMALSVSKQKSLQCGADAVATGAIDPWWKLVALGKFKNCQRYHAIFRDSSNKGVHVSFDYKPDANTKVTSLMVCKTGGEVVYRNPRLSSQYDKCE